MTDTSPLQSESTDKGEMRFCSECGKEILQPARFCPYCGHPIDSAGNPPGTGASSNFPIEEKDFMVFVADNAGYYMREFRKFSIAGTDTFSVTWNWAAFCGGFGWMLYRKMYLWAVIAFLLSFVPYLGLAAWIAFAAVANYLYYDHAKKKILDIRTLHPSGDISVILSHIGGVNRWVPVAATIFTILLLLLFLAISLLIPFSFYDLFNLFRTPSKYI